MNEKETFPAAKELGELTAKVDLMLSTVNALQQQLQTQYVQKTETEDMKRRLDKLETAPTRWLPIIMAAAALLLQFLQFAGR